MITIDGSYGEGGGQILRTALALSLITGKPLRIEKIRAGRKNPGLLRQHLTSVQAAAKVGQAETTGVNLGSTQLTFTPGKITPGDYHFAIGTAGSATLVLQTVLPALMIADAPTTLTLEGGTHNPFAPPFDFLELAFLPLLKRMGVRVDADLINYGFYPAGGGKLEFTIHPVAKPSELSRLDLPERGEIRDRRARVVLCNLPRNIADRELNIVEKKLSWPKKWHKVETPTNCIAPGNFVSLEIECDYVTEVFTGFGERTVAAEAVADQATLAARRYLASEAAVGEYLADQLLLPMALAGGGRFTTLPPSRHTTTNIEIIKKFLDLEITCEQTTNRVWKIEIEK